MIKCELEDTFFAWILNLCNSNEEKTFFRNNNIFIGIFDISCLNNFNDVANFILNLILSNLFTLFLDSLIDVETSDNLLLDKVKD